MFYPEIRFFLVSSLLHQRQVLIRSRYFPISRCLPNQLHLDNSAVSDALGTKILVQLRVKRQAFPPDKSIEFFPLV